MTQPVERFPGLPVARTSDLDEARESVTAVFLPHDLRLAERASALPDPAEVAVPGALVAPIRTQHPQAEGADLRFDLAPCR